MPPIEEIPAFAGMTGKVGMTLLAGMADKVEMTSKDFSLTFGSKCDIFKLNEKKLKLSTDSSKEANLIS